MLLTSCTAAVLDSLVPLHLHGCNLLDCQWLPLLKFTVAMLSRKHVVSLPCGGACCLLRCPVHLQPKKHIVNLLHAEVPAACGGACCMRRCLLQAEMPAHVEKIAACA